MIENKENEKINLSAIWNFSENFSHNVLVSDMKKIFILDFNNFLVNFLNMDMKIFRESLAEQISTIQNRSRIEKSFWLSEIERIKNYSREQAINELIKSRKIYERLKHIDEYTSSIML